MHDENTTPTHEQCTDVLAAIVREHDEAVTA